MSEGPDPAVTFPVRSIVGLRVHAPNYASATEQILAWARAGASRCVAVTNVNTVMECHDAEPVRQVVNACDLRVPDGVPLVWALRLLGVEGASRVYGPNLTLSLLRAAAEAQVPVGFYGGSPKILELWREFLKKHYPSLPVAYIYEPPRFPGSVTFRPLTPEEDARIVEDINRSGARILFVGLGSTLQDTWTLTHRGRISAVMVGVGAAFDFLVGAKPQAPAWMMRAGLEWLFRLLCEPRRLWRRYCYHNPRFVALFLLQLLGWRPAE
jgi:N-acetylglucosaminyldiphosphoundecaprenol N-acetyl-beta-D-mannosaminyltransferase